MPFGVSELHADIVDNPQSASAKLQTPRRGRCQVPADKEALQQRVLDMVVFSAPRRQFGSKKASLRFDSKALWRLDAELCKWTSAFYHSLKRFAQWDWSTCVWFASRCVDPVPVAPFLPLSALFI